MSPVNAVCVLGAVEVGIGESVGEFVAVVVGPVPMATLCRRMSFSTSRPKEYADITKRDKCKERGVERCMSWEGRSRDVNVSTRGYVAEELGRSDGIWELVSRSQARR